MADSRFPARYRLRKRADFARVYELRRTASDALLLVFVAGNGLPHPRLGLSVSRKVGGAVERNRWKRRLREAFRLKRAELPSGIDMIVIPRASQEPALEALQRSLVRLAQRAADKLPDD